MGYFADYLNRRRKAGVALVDGVGGYNDTFGNDGGQRLQAPDRNIKELSPIHNQEQFYSMEPKAPLPAEAKLEQPEIDSSDAIGSLVKAIGPNPAEREARMRKLERQRQQMTRWAALFDGLRQLGNLYSTVNGARPQQLTTPYAQIDASFDRQQQLEDNIDNYRRQYTMQLYNLQRQHREDARKAKLAEIQANYYNTRDDVARMKAENDRLKAEKWVELQDGRIAKLNVETGRIEQLLPLQEREIESRIGKNDRMGRGRSGGNGVPYKEHYVIDDIDPKTGKPIKKYVAGRYPNEEEEPVNTTVKKGNTATNQQQNNGKRGRNATGNLLPKNNNNQQGKQNTKKQQQRGNLLPKNR